MKKLALFLLAALFAVATLLPALAEETPLTWRDYTVTVTGMDTGGFFAPADMTADEYCVSLHLVPDEALAPSDDLVKELYAELLLQDAEGNTYQAGVLLSSDSERTFLYAIPKTVELDQLTVVFADAAAAEETAEAAP